ncbi:Copper transport outer membrane protein, MctB [Friedmanniella luteola]|uniref:Copper transport outer membrane protein, MctB n=1 Tax=Friedmanniella luteola TaxID=546871 RepID=A0A1H1QUN4_9ACTN|nr:copper transporter [Friedmanniella luteola]SDS27198.1 Copper transport outer membrane protein, MctB [Friedmanniella luteola]
MINFRYHIVSLMAVFLALAVGIAVGVSLSPSVRSGLNAQADQDRKQVIELRSELDRVNALDEYREAWAGRAGAQVAAGALTGVGVAVVSMPDAPNPVVQAITEAVTGAGGTVVSTVRVDSDVFDPSKAEVVDEAVAPYTDELQLQDDMTPATRFGRALGFSVAAKAPQERDDLAVGIGDALEKAGLATLSGDSARRAELVVVVSAAASDPQPAPEVLQAHVQADVGLVFHAAGLVLAGPNSESITGTDVLTARTDDDAADVLSTVDVADLPSGVITTVLAGQEQLQGRQGHYGALTRADAPLPTLPVR